MANIKKNFNFRNGVQVDDDNLLVTSTGLVGIGTTIPVEALDVRGNVVITGFTSATTQKVGFLTVTTLEPEKVIGAGISIVSGIVTAQGTGIITYFGDASNLLGMPTSQWEDKDVGLGFTSIYNTGGNVGIATEDPRTTLQVGGNIDAGERGIGISSVGNINAAGIVTATTFVGNLTGDVSGRISGDTVGNVNSSGLSTFTNLSVTGLTTFAGITTFTNKYVAFNPPIGSQVDFFGGLPQQRMRFRNNGSNSALHLNTYVNLWFGDTQTTQMEAHGTGNARHFRIENYQEHSELGGTYNTASGLKNTFQVHSDFTTFQGSPTGGHEARTISEFNYSDGASLFHFGNKKLQTSGVGVTITSQLDVTNVNVSGVATISEIRSDSLNLKNAAGTETLATFTNNGAAVLKFDDSTKLQTTNSGITVTGIESPNLAVTQKIGVGTTDTPTSDIQVKKLFGNAEIQVSSAEAIASLNVGREIGTAKTHTSEIRFGGGAGAPYSASGTALDIINYDTGNFNYHLSGNNANAVVGDFHWHKGINSARLMTLTGIGGSLGIGNTQPTKELDVTGAGNFSGNLTVGNNLTVNGLLLGNVQGTLTGNVSGTLAGNANATVGVSTLNNLTIAGVVTTTELFANNRIGIGTDSEEHVFMVNEKVDPALDDSPQVFVTATGGIGIKTTTELPNVSINAHECGVVVGGLGVGSTIVVGAVDMREAGRPSNNATDRFMFPPQVTSTQRGNLSGVLAGAMIYLSLIHI